jgi:hypothetical protein
MVKAKGLTHISRRFRRVADLGSHRRQQLVLRAARGDPAAATVFAKLK